MWEDVGKVVGGERCSDVFISLSFTHTSNPPPSHAMLLSKSFLTASVQAFAAFHPDTWSSLLTIVPTSPLVHL